VGRPDLPSGEVPERLLAHPEEGVDKEARRLCHVPCAVHLLQRRQGEGLHLGLASAGQGAAEALEAGGNTNAGSGCDHDAGSVRDADFGDLATAAPDGVVQRQYV
jgi:hypothetical protein